MFKDYIESHEEVYSNMSKLISTVSSNKFFTNEDEDQLNFWANKYNELISKTRDIIKGFDINSSNDLGLMTKYYKNFGIVRMKFLNEVIGIEERLNKP